MLCIAAFLCWQIFVLSINKNVSQTLGSISVVTSLNIDSYGLPLQCVSLASFFSKLLITMLAPAVFCVCIFVGCVVWHGLLLRDLLLTGPEVAAAQQKKSERSDSLQSLQSEHHPLKQEMLTALKQGMLTSLPAVLFISFMVFPAVASLAFQGLDCEEFEDTRQLKRRFLKADYMVDCDGDEYTPVFLLSLVAILFYPVGLPIVYWLLLRQAKTAIIEDRPTALSHALDFLHRDFLPKCYYWEIIETQKKLFLVGFASVIMPGTMYQLLIAFMVTLIHMLCMAIYHPYRARENDYFVLACNFSLTTVFLFCVLLKVSVLTDAVDDVMTPSLKQRFEMQSQVITFGLGLSVLSVIVLACMVTVQQIIAAARLPIVRLVETEGRPDLTLKKTQRWHLFCSYNWGTGQEQCAIVKRLLCMYMPGSRVFLDVDGMQADEVERNVDRSVVFMIFLSKGYFTSKSCHREVQHAMDMRKPVVLVHDPLRGGASLEFMRREECPQVLHDAVFFMPDSNEERDVIEWHHIKVLTPFALCPP